MVPAAAAQLAQQVPLVMNLIDNATSAATLESGPGVFCPHFTLRDGPRTPLFGFTSALLMLIIGATENSLVIILYARRRYHQGASHVLLNFICTLAVVELLNCTLILGYQLLQNLLLWRPNEWPAVTVTISPLLVYGHFVCLAAVSWAGLTEILLTNLIAAERFLLTFFPSKDFILNQSCCVQALLIAGSLVTAAVFPALGLWCDVAHADLEGVRGSLLGPDMILRSRRSDCVTSMVSYAGLILSVMTVSCLFYLIIIVKTMRRNCEDNTSSDTVVSMIQGRPRRKILADIRAQGIVIGGIDTLITVFCWAPLLVHSILQWTQQTLLVSADQKHTEDLPVPCTVDPDYVRVALLPILFHPFIFLVGSNEARYLFEYLLSSCCRARGQPEAHTSPFFHQQHDPLPRSITYEQDSAGYRDRRASVKRNVCFEVEESRSKSSFLPDFFGRSKMPKRKNTRHWKRYSCSSSSEPMSIFMSSTSSINYVHPLLQNAPLPDALYKREMIARRSSAFKSSSNISSTATDSSSKHGNTATTAPLLLDSPERRRCSF